MSFGSYFCNVYTLIGIIGLATTCAFAWWKGGPAERLGTAMLAISWIGADLARGVSGEQIPTVIILGSDVLLAAGFLYVAVRYSSLWLGAAMILQAGAFALHAAQLSAIDNGPRWHGFILYLLLDNLRSYAVLLALTGGVAAAIVKRRRQAREKAAAEARSEAARQRKAQFIVPPPPPAAAI
jgi:hypothetical protein